MTSWWSGYATLLDTETDDKEPTEARIITGAVVDCRPRIAPQINTCLLQPERPIPIEATNIHRITTEYAAEKGVPRDLGVAAIATALAANASPDRPVIGHNVRFDLTILDREMRRTGVGSLGIDGVCVTVRVDGRQVGAFHVIDTLCVDKWVDPYRKGRRTLDATADHYGVPIRGDAHTAEADALAAGRVAWAIARRCDMNTDQLVALYRDRRDPLNICRDYLALRGLTLPQLHHAQISWAADQAAGLRDYFAKNPDKGDPLGVSSAWPLEPVGTVDAVTDLV